MSCLINEDFKTHDEIPLVIRGFTDLWKRDWNGKKVAVKSLRFALDNDRGKAIKVTASLINRSRGSHGELTLAYRSFAKK